jgi:TetR/AcrR family transcriptional regulator, mexJK operon transcriptional repressor
VDDEVAEGRSARKRRAIVDAATELFLRNGYQGTSMDEVAARAAVSKQTVYKNFADKEQLFTGIVLGVAGNAEHVVGELTAALREHPATTAAELERALTELARRYLDAVLAPEVLALRRLVVAEADRFPDLARTYYRQAPARAVEVLAAALESYVDGGLLRAPDRELAASTFGYLVLARAQDRALFHPGQRLSRTDRDRHATEAVRVFLAAYGG